MADLSNKNAREAVEARGQKSELSREALKDDYRKLEAEGCPDGGSFCGKSFARWTSKIKGREHLLPI